MVNPQARLDLAENEIHVWMINPQQIKASEEIYALLNSEEQNKVARYRLDKAKHTALITRAFIRLLLSQYTAVKPQQWQFSVSKLGKPEISNSPLPLRFNLSHNNELIICALTLSKDIGCDIENLGRKINIEAITKRFFSPSEYQLIKANPSQFFQYWTLKEAFVKATGLGISQGLDTFSFEIHKPNSKDCHDNISLLFNEKCQEETPQNWYHRLLFPDDKHCIALSINNKKRQIKNQLSAYSQKLKGNYYLTVDRRRCLDKVLISTCNI
ncbi:4'-phosphopantetheinyl transferase family protein [Psychromonas sp. KJ10-10]|uniref:4'-phosphopantetheinyl transferase family protein n=1 Tax=Psychromonas sp. KJ10-10 TaxID=3391823 RepID=UPI0039B41832